MACRSLFAQAVFCFVVGGIPHQRHAGPKEANRVQESDEEESEETAANAGTARGRPVSASRRSSRPSRRPLPRRRVKIHCWCVHAMRDTGLPAPEVPSLAQLLQRLRYHIWRPARCRLRHAVRAVQAAREGWGEWCSIRGGGALCPFLFDWQGPRGHALGPSRRDARRCATYEDTQGGASHEKRAGR